MARQSGKAADFSFNSVQIESELNSITQNTDITLPEVTAFGDSAATYVEGLPNSITSDVGGSTTYSADIQISGALTRAVS